MVIVNGGGSPGHIIGAVGSLLRAAVVNLFVPQQITFVPTTQSRRPARRGRNGRRRHPPAGHRPDLFPLLDTAAGLGYVEAGHARGKVVITLT